MKKGSTWIDSETITKSPMQDPKTCTTMAGASCGSRLFLKGRSGLSQYLAQDVSHNVGYISVFFN